MIRVVVIEDRVLTLNALRESIDWQAEGVQPIGFFESCEEALPFILKERPDVVVTDIVMRGMDGIQLSECLRREAPDTKIIIISAHSQFEYAQRALQAGVFNYFEKPVDFRALLECVVQAGEELKHQQQLVQYVNNHMAFYRERFFIKLLLGQTQGGEGETERELAFLKLPEGHAWRCAAFTIRALDAHGAEGEASMRREMQNLLFTRELEGVFSRARLHGPLSLTGDTLTAVFSAPEGEREQLLELPRRLRELIDRFVKRSRVVIHCGIGEAVDQIMSLRESYAGAQEALAACFPFEDSTALCSCELPEDQGAQWYGLLQLEEQLVKAAKQGDELLVEQAFGQMRRHAAGRMAPPGMLKMLMKSALFKVEGFREQGPGDTSSALAAIDGAGSMEELFCFVQRRCAQLCRAVRAAHESQRKQLIERAKRYIEQSYMNDQFCLNDVSRYVSVSPNYISSLFKKECGKGIHEYLTELRIEKARELLISTDISVGQVGERVGYSNPYYFSSNFKKITEYTPTEYRRRNQKK